MQKVIIEITNDNHKHIDYSHTLIGYKNSLFL
jgi:hypothetical protein